MRRFILIILLFHSHLSFAQYGRITTLIGRPGIGYETGIGGPATAATICNAGPYLGPDGTAYIMERYCGYLRKITPDGTFLPFAFNGGDSSSGDGGPATAASLQWPWGLAFDSHGDMYVGEKFKVRKIDMRTGIISTYAGTGAHFDSGYGGPATAAGVPYPEFLHFDKDDNLFICSETETIITKIDRRTGNIYKVAGTFHVGGLDGDGGPATAAKIYGHGFIIDSSGAIYLAEQYNIRRIDPVTHIIDRYAGNDSSGYAGEGLPRLSSQILPYGIVQNSRKDLIIGRRIGNNFRIMSVHADDERVYTFAGMGDTGYSADGTRVDSVKLRYVDGLNIDSCDNIYYLDNTYSVIRKIAVPQTGALSATIVAGSSVDWLCYGMPITFYCTLGNPRYRGHYRWTVNGTTMSGDAPNFRYSPTNGDTVRCFVTPRFVCDTTSPVSSNIIIMTVSSLPAPVISLTTGSVTAHLGDTVRLTATITGTAGSYEIHWRNRGNLFATTTIPTVSYIKGTGNDTITATLVSTARTCYDSVTSNNKYIDSPVSIPEVTNYNVGTINCYPNPVSKNLTIESEQYWNQLEISDALGKIVYSTHLETPAKSHSLTSSNWAPGVYFVKIDRYRVIRVVKE